MKTIHNFLLLLLTVSFTVMLNGEAFSQSQNEVIFTWTGAENSSFSNSLSLILIL